MPLEPLSDPLVKQMADTMEANGDDPALVYAYRRSGVVVTAENRETQPTHLVDRFDEAMAEYFDASP